MDSSTTLHFIGVGFSNAFTNEFFMQLKGEAPSTSDFPSEIVFIESFARFGGHVVLREALCKVGHTNQLGDNPGEDICTWVRSGRREQIISE